MSSNAVKAIAFSLFLGALTLGMAGCNAGSEREGVGEEREQEGVVEQEGVGEREEVEEEREQEGVVGEEEGEEQKEADDD